MVGVPLPPRPLCHLNGHLLPLDEAALSPLDRGFVYGDALYEVVKVASGVPLFLAEHLARLERGLAEVDIPSPPDLAGRCRELLSASGLEEGSLYLQVSRGAGPRTHVPPAGWPPTVFLVPMPSATSSTDREVPEGLRAITLQDPRWGRCDLKTTSLMGTVLGKLAARRAGVEEVLFLAPDGRLREGGSTSLFVRRRERLETHPLGPHILPGITRRHVVGLARELGLPLRERAPRLAELAEWQEAFACGTLTAVRPLVEVDGRRVGDGSPGAWTRRLAAALRERELAEVARADRG